MVTQGMNREYLEMSLTVRAAFNNLMGRRVNQDLLGQVKNELAGRPARIRKPSRNGRCITIKQGACQ